MHEYKRKLKVKIKTWYYEWHEWRLTCSQSDCYRGSRQHTATNIIRLYLHKYNAFYYTFPKREERVRKRVGDTLKRLATRNWLCTKRVNHHTKKLDNHMSSKLLFLNHSGDDWMTVSVIQESAFVFSLVETLVNFITHEHLFNSCRINLTSPFAHW